MVRPATAHAARSYGFLLEELGFYPNLLNPLLHNYIRPLATLLFPGAPHGSSGLRARTGVCLRVRVSACCMCRSAVQPCFTPTSAVRETFGPQSSRSPHTPKMCVSSERPHRNLPQSAQAPHWTTIGRSWYGIIRRRTCSWTIITTTRR